MLEGPLRNVPISTGKPHHTWFSWLTGEQRMSIFVHFGFIEWIELLATVKANSTNFINDFTMWPSVKWSFSYSVSLER